MTNLYLLPGVIYPDKPISEQPDGDVIIQLEQALQWAKEGKIQAAALAIVTHDDKLYTSFEGSKLKLLISAVRILDHRLVSDRAEPLDVEDTEPAA